MNIEDKAFIELGKSKIASKTKDFDELIEHSVDNKNLLDNLVFLEENLDSYSTFKEFDSEFETLRQKGFTKNRYFIYGLLVSLGILLLGLSLYFFGFKPKVDSTQIAILPDSSKIELYDGATIFFDNSFNVSERNTKLTGSAFFDVHHDSQKPFNIQMDHFSVRVLGTSFFIKKKQEELIVEVYSGKVSISNRKESTIITKGEKVNATQETIVVSEFTPNGLINIAFENTSIVEIFQILERKYNYSFDLSKVMSSECHFNGSFKNSTIFDVLEEFKLLYNLEYDIKESGISIKKIEC